MKDYHFPIGVIVLCCVVSVGLLFDIVAKLDSIEDKLEDLRVMQVKVMLTSEDDLNTGDDDIVVYQETEL